MVIVGEGFKKNRWEIRGLRDLLDGDWEEGSELESAEEVVDRMEVDEEVRELDKEMGIEVRKEGWKETRSEKSRKMGRWVVGLEEEYKEEEERSEPIRANFEGYKKMENKSELESEVGSEVVVLYVI